LPIITLREAIDPYGELTELDFGNISASETSGALSFRVYDNFDDHPDIWGVDSLRVGLSLFNKTEIITALRKELETHILVNGIIEIKCVWSAKLQANPAVEWTVLQMDFDGMGNIVGHYADTDFDYLSGESPNNYNEYQIRLIDFPDLNVTKEEYTIQLTLGWDINRYELVI